jgi:bifunctional non-homologous end joining protein LigD
MAHSHHRQTRTQWEVRDRYAARAGLEYWKERHPAAAARLRDDDILVDSMRGRSTTWTRIRINLRHVPEDERPPEEPPVPDYDPWRDSGRG